MNEKQFIPLGELVRPTKKRNINPQDFPNEIFELFSIPSFDKGYPEIIKGFEIGSTKQLVEPGDTLLSKIVPHIRRSWVVSDKKELRQIASGEWLVFKNEKADGKYLSYYLTSDRFHAAFMNTVAGVGGSLNRARPEHVYKILIPLPPIEEQRRIAKILDKIHQNKSLINKVKNQSLKLKQSIYVEKFGDPSLNPYSLQTKKLKEIVKNENHQRIPIKVSDRERIKGSIPYYGASGIIDHVNNFTHKGERLLIGEDGANLISRSTPIAFIAKGSFWVNNHAHVLAYKGIAHLRFLEIFFSLIRLEPYVTGSAQPKLNQSNLNNILVPLPEISEQLFFCKLCSKLDYQQDLLVKQKQLTEEFIKSISTSFF